MEDSIFNWPDVHSYLFPNIVVLRWDDEVKEKCTLKWVFPTLNIQYVQTGLIFFQFAMPCVLHHLETFFIQKIFQSFMVLQCLYERGLSTQRNDLLNGHLKCIYFHTTWIIYAVYFATHREEELRRWFFRAKKAVFPHKHQASTQNVLISDIIN